MGTGRGDDQGTTHIRTAASEDPENLRRQQRTGPFYGLRRLWQRVSRAKPVPPQTPANARTSLTGPTLKPSYSQVTRLGIGARDPGKQHVIGTCDRPRDLQVL